MVEIIQIDSNTWRFENEYVRFFLLVGDEKAALIDSGFSVPNALELAKGLTTKPIILINTHGDMDHTSGTGAFSEIHMHNADYTGCKVSEKYSQTALVEINDGDVIDLGNRQLKAIHIPGHTRGSVAFLDKSKRVLYAGDTVQKGHIFMFGPHRCPEIFEASLDKLIEIKDSYDAIYASHDEFCLPSDYVEKVKEAWKMVKEGKIAFEETNLHGCTVKSYTTDVCGFFME